MDFKIIIKIKKVQSLFLLFFISILLSYNLNAIEKIDTRGKEFYISFIPNFHTNDIRISRTDSLIIYIASEKPCRVNINAIDNQGRKTTRTINITQPNVVESYSYYYVNYSLNGFNTRQQIELNNGGHERVAVQHFYIDATEDISVYAANYAHFSTDAFMVLPTHMLGQEYMIMSYYSDVAIDLLNEVRNGTTPSQYSVTATEDNTKVTLVNKTFTVRNGKNEIEIVLNKGESYLVQADPTRDNNLSDLTGSIVRSDKPVAVFSGHQRAAIPFDIEVSNRSRDILVEQCTPTKFWGKNAIISPLPLPRKQNNFKNDIYRILALYDDTEIFMNDRFITKLNSGEFYQNFLDSAYFITSSAPISVAVFKKTVATGNDDIDYYGDPYMALLPPVEQFHNVYLSTNIQIRIDFENKFTEHYITVYIADTLANSLTIDDLPVDFTRLKRVSNSNYLYGDFQVSSGFHTVKSNGKVGILISGYGPANSYGYLGGISQYPVDYNQPKVYTTDLCGEVKILATDTLEYDLGIAGVEVIESDNIALEIPLVNLPTPVYEFGLKLIDIYKSGSIKLKIKDGSNSWVTKDYKIDAVSVMIDKVDDLIDGIEDLTYNVDIKLPENRERCFEFKVKNLSSNDFAFNSIKSINNKVKINNINITKINANRDLLIKFCIASNEFENGNFSDTIYLYSDCLELKLANINYEVQKDNIEPTVISFNENCDDFEIEITENTTFDKGIERIEIIEQENCEVNKTKDGAFSQKYKISIIDKSQDMFIKLNILDSLGNVKTYEKLVQGFSLTTSPDIREFKPETIKIESALIGDYNCGAITLYNFGKRDFTINELDLIIAQDYYVPKSQLPLVVPVGGSAELFVCFYTQRFSEMYFDSIKFTHNCVDYFVKLESEKQKDLLVIDKCGGEFVIKVEDGEYNISDFYPNPSSDRTNFIIKSPEESKIDYYIYDYLGNEKLKIENVDLKSGINKIEIDTQNLKSGIYNVSIKINNQIINNNLNVVR